MHTFFAYLARMKYIQRWGLMRNSFPENDAEHTLQTIMIAHGLAVIREKIFHESCDAEHCAMLAVYHDAGEAFPKGAFLLYLLSLYICHADPL